MNGVTEVKQSNQKVRKVTIGEKDLQKLLRGSQSTRSHKKINLPYHKKHRFDDLLPQIEENSLSDGTMSEHLRGETFRKRN